MKNVMKSFIVVILCLSVTLLSSCSKEKNDSSKGVVKFSMNFGSQVKSSFMADSLNYRDSTSSYYAVVSIADENGQVVVNSKRLQIFSFGGSYLSESISLEVGNYKLTEFVIVKGSRVVYVSPVIGSVRAQLVSNPLPIALTVSGNATTAVQPEVLNAENISPAEFGYASFNFNIIETMVFKIIVCRDSSIDTLNALQAGLKVRAVSYPVLTNSDTSGYAYKVFDFNLQPFTNTIEVTKAAMYTLTVSKPGYNVWSNDFSSEALHTFKNNPLKVSLHAISYPDSLVWK